MIGHKFSKWLVISYSHKNKHYQHFWNCRCDCGTEKVIAQAQLTNEYATQCRLCSNAARRKHKRLEPGNNYGKWLVLKEDDQDKRYVHVQCECGNIKRVIKSSLSHGESTRCTSCARREGAISHGHNCKNNPSPEYRAWCNMKNRCYNEKVAHYHNYGGRGILVHESWMKFENFLKDVGPRPSSKHSLDRIEVNGHYEPGNVIWALAKEQVTNRRVSFKQNGTYIDVAALAKEIRAKPKTVKLLLKIASQDQIREYGKLDHYQKSMFGMLLKREPELTFDQIINKILSTPLARQKRAPLFSLWRSMIKRCCKPTDKDFPNYGGRGIRVCDEWCTYDGFEKSVLTTIGPRPSPKYCLDRIDPNGNYEPGNVRWATGLEQARNKRQSPKINGIGVAAYELSAKHNLGSDTVVKLIRLGWDERGIAFYANLPFKEKKRLAILKNGLHQSSILPPGTATEIQVKSGSLRS